MDGNGANDVDSNTINNITNRKTTVPITLMETILLHVEWMVVVMKIEDLEADNNMLMEIRM